MTLLDILNVIGAIILLSVFVLCVILGPRRERYIRPAPLPPIDHEDNGAANREMLRTYRKQKLPPTRGDWEERK